MLVIVYSIYLSLLVLIIIGFIKESLNLDDLISTEKRYRTPLFNFGKKQNAFTIESSRMILTSAAFKMSFLRKMYCDIFGIFFNVDKFYAWAADISVRLAIKSMQEKALDNDYIINYKVNTQYIGNGIFVADARATAIKLYKDTLGLFKIPSDIIKFKPVLKRMHLVRNFLRSMMVMFMVLVGIVFGFYYYADSILSDITFVDEQEFWQAISDSSYIKNRNDGGVLKDAEFKINSILKKIEFSDRLSQYDFEVLLEENSNAEVTILPAGKIMITKGLLKVISSEQELMFVIFDAIGHYENKSHFRDMGQDIITPYLLLKLLGPKNYLVYLAFSASGYFSQSFDRDVELQSNEFALIQLNNLYGNVGSIDIIAENILHEEIDYNDAHPINKHDLEVIRKTYGLKEGAMLPLEFTIDKPKILLHRDESDKTRVKFYDEIEKRLNDVYLNYNDAIHPLLDVLEPEGLATVEGIDSKLKVVEYGIKVSYHFSERLRKDLQESMKIIDAEFKKQKDQDEARFAKASMIEAVNDFEVMMRFYLERDFKIIKLQRTALNFLRDRSGTYSIKGGKIVFNSQYEQDSFGEIIDRISKLSEQKPDNEIKKWSLNG